MLTITNLNAGYGELKILSDVNIKIERGQIVALIGPNGAGKSTVLKSVFNMCSVYSGKVVFGKKNITGLKTHQLLAHGVSFVPQGRINFSDLTIKENLLVGATLVKDEKLIEERMENVYSKFPVLKEKENELAFSLSGGQQQMLALGRALMQDPKLLLMDEPTLGLSPLLQKQLFHMLKILRDEGISILIVEQNAKKAIEMADVTYLLENGSIVLSGSKDILKNSKIKKVYLGGS